MVILKSITSGYESRLAMVVIYGYYKYMFRRQFDRHITFM